MKCMCCDLPATWVVSGIAEFGRETSAAASPVCDTHKIEFEAWGAADTPDLLYGYSVLYDIETFDEGAWRLGI